MIRCKSLILGLVLGFAPVAGAAAAPASEKVLVPAVEQATPPIEKFVQARPALWVVKDDDTTIYLFGTIHLLKREILWFDGPVRKAFDSAQEVVLEVADDDGTKSQSLMLEHAMQPGLPAISSQLPPAQSEKFLAALQDNGVPPTLLDHVKPWFAALTLSVLPLQRYGYSAESGVDRAIKAEALAAGKSLVGLETAQEQIGFFDGMSTDLQLALLGETLNELPELPATIEKMIGAWSDGDPDRLAALLNESVDGNPDLRKLLLTDRNDRWADWIKARLEKPGTVLVAVGAGHLAGDGSVQQMLKTRGITATLLPRE